MRGSLALVGSGEYLPEMAELEKSLIQDGLNHGKANKFIQIPTAAGRESKDRLEFWRELGARQASLIGTEQIFLPIFDRESANSHEYADLISDSALIYMSGGDPHFLAETLTGTPVWKAIIKNWHSGGSLAGCSAGAIEMFRVAARTVGLKVGEGLHQLRHTCVSVLIAEGANPKEIQEWVGHASIEETMDTYGHLFPNAKHQLSGMLDNYAKKHSDNVPLSVAN